MLEVRRLLATTVLFICAVILLPVPAHAIDLTGAWASQGDLCKLVFTNKGNTVTFTELSDLYGSGFASTEIGSRERLPNARSLRESRMATISI
jgi:hypothetical protein